MIPSIQPSGLVMPKIGYAQITGKPQCYDALNNIKQVKPFVDHCILVYDEIEPEVKENLEHMKVHLIQSPHENNWANFRNQYLIKARSLGLDYLLISDTDEHFNEMFLSHLKQIPLQIPEYNGFKVLSKVEITNKDKLDEGELSPYSDRFHKLVFIRIEPWMHEPGMIEPVTIYSKDDAMSFTDWRTLNLPEGYFYTHTKDAIKVWEGAVRDIVVGSNDRVDRSPETKQLIRMLHERNLTNWIDVKAYFENGNIDAEIAQFIKDVRSSDYTPFRSMFKWYYYHLYPIENTDGLKSEYTPKKEDVVSQAYLDILHRHPDDSGMIHYTAQLNNGDITEKELRDLLRKSDENIAHVIDTAYIQEIGRTPVVEERELFAESYRAGILTDPAKFLHGMMYMMQTNRQRVAYCQMTHSGDFQATLENIKSAKSYVDDVVVVYDDTLSSEQVKAFKEAGALAYYFKWHDNFPEMRNNYLTIARHQGAKWVIVSDPDEHFDEKFLKELRTVILPQADMAGLGCLQINAHDIFSDDEDGKKRDIPEECIPNYYKNLIFKLGPGVQYVGSGKAANVHETLIVGGRTVNLPPIYFYRHIKTHVEIWEHAVRNLFVGGGGNNRGDSNPHWLPLRKITDRLGIKFWKELRAYMKAGNIDSELKQYIIDNRNSYCHDWDSEQREMFKWYFYVLHPEENVDNLKVDPEPPRAPDETEEYVKEQYKKILGRDADYDGRTHYTEAIKSGQMTKDAFVQTLVGSDEYRMRRTGLVAV